MKQRGYSPRKRRGQNNHKHKTNKPVKKWEKGESRCQNKVRTHLNREMFNQDEAERLPSKKEERTEHQQRGIWRLTNTRNQQTQWCGVAVTDTPAAFS